jgi:hypothetical protein
MPDLKLRNSKLITVMALVAAFLLGSATYGAVQMAGATGTNTTYYACLSSRVDCRKSVLHRRLVQPDRQSSRGTQSVREVQKAKREPTASPTTAQ